MSRFTGPLAVTFLGARSGLAHLDQALIWEIGEEGSGREVRVPRGFVSDGITAPRLVWWLLPPWGHGATRAAIDAEFHRALRACGVSRPLAALMWTAVRLAAAWRTIVPKQREKVQARRA